jgi:hypothetical protein
MEVEISYLGFLDDLLEIPTQLTRSPKTTVRDLEGGKESSEGDALFPREVKISLGLLPLAIPLNLKNNGEALWARGQDGEDS